MSSGNLRKVYLETCVFLRVFLSQSEQHVAKASIEAAEQKFVQGYISALVVAEAIGAPNLRAPQGSPSPTHVARLDRARDYFHNCDFRYVDATARAARMAMEFAVDFQLKGPDALHLGLAVMAGCDELHTFDGKLLAVGNQVAGIRVCRPYGSPQSSLDV